MSDIDRRAEFRSEVSKSATIKSIDGSYKSTCLIRNASKQGCQIIMHSTGEVPDTINLYIDGLKAPKEGLIKWRTKNRVGIKFTR